jgi:hypothetical protein
VKNFRYVEKTSAECNEDSYLAILHLSRVELHCKLQEKLQRVTWPLLVHKNIMVTIYGALNSNWGEVPLEYQEENFKKILYQESIEQTDYLCQAVHLQNKIDTITAWRLLKCH